MDALHSLQRAYRASLRLFLASGWVVPTSGGCGLTRSQSFASYDPALASLKTRQQSLALMMDGPSLESSVDWPRSGMMCCGEAFSLPPWMQDISGSGAASLLPTPLTTENERGNVSNPRQVSSTVRQAMRLPTLTTRQPITDADMLRNTPNMACFAQKHLLPTPRASASEASEASEARTYTVPDSHEQGKHGKHLQGQIIAKLLPTPTTRDYKDTPGMDTTRDGKEGGRLDQLPRVIFAAESAAPIGGMKLTPEFQCWLMGFPPDWLKRLRAVRGTR